MDWLLSAITIWQAHLAGNKHPMAWAVGLIGQALWLAWIVMSENWGFLPLTLFLTAIYARNHWKWQR